MTWKCPVCERTFEEDQVTHDRRCPVEGTGLVEAKAKAKAKKELGAPLRQGLVQLCVSTPPMTLRTNRIVAVSGEAYHNKGDAISGAQRQGVDDPRTA